jgi:hypothetical protein
MISRSISRDCQVGRDVATAQQRVVEATIAGSEKTSALHAAREAADDSGGRVAMSRAARMTRTSLRSQMTAMTKAKKTAGGSRADSASPNGTSSTGPTPSPKPAKNGHAHSRKPAPSASAATASATTTKAAASPTAASSALPNAMALPSFRPGCVSHR